MKKILIICFLLFLVLFLPGHSYSEETIHITAGEWSPYLSEKIEDNGIAGRIIKEAFALEGIKVKISFLPWKRAYSEAEKGKYNGTAVWLKKPDRKKTFYYSDPVIEEQHVFFYLKSYPFKWNAIEDLMNHKVGGLLGFSYGPVFDDAIKAGEVKMHRLPTDIQAFGMLLKKRIQVYPQELNVGYEALYGNFLIGETQLVTHHPKPFHVDFSYLLLSKKIERNKHLIEIFNKNLKRLKESGEINRYFKEAREEK